MPEEQVFTNVLVKPLYNTELKRWYWLVQGWYNDAVIGAHPPDSVVEGRRIYKTQRGALLAGLRVAARIR